MLLDRSGRDEHAAALRASASDGDLSVGSCGVVFSAIGRRVLFVSLIPFGKVLAELADLLAKGRKVGGKYC